MAPVGGVEGGRERVERCFFFSFFFPVSRSTFFFSSHQQKNKNTKPPPPPFFFKPFYPLEFIRCIAETERDRSV